MRYWSYRCIKCGKDIQEPVEGSARGRQITGAICRPCCREIFRRETVADLLCEWCRVNYKRDRRAGRSYGMWGLCGDCYAELGQPKLGSGRPTIGRDGKVNFGRFPAAVEAPSPVATATLPELPKLNPTREQRSEK